MERIRALECPLQRCALLTARWSGARRTEIRKLHLDCLDAYSDGTPRLRLAAGKSLRERAVPVHEEAAQAIRDLVKLRERLCLERKLADDARERGWEREVDRHERVAGRIRSLLSELGEPCAPPENLD